MKIAVVVDTPNLSTRIKLVDRLLGEARSDLHDLWLLRRASGESRLSVTRSMIQTELRPLVAAFLSVFTEASETKRLVIVGETGAPRAWRLHRGHRGARAIRASFVLAIDATFGIGGRAPTIVADAPAADTDFRRRGTRSQRLMGMRRGARAVRLFKPTRIAAVVVHAGPVVPWRVLTSPVRANGGLPFLPGSGYSPFEAASDLGLPKLHIVRRSA